MTRVTIKLDCAGTEENGMYETALPNWGGSNSEHSLGKQERQKYVTKFLIPGISGNWN